MSAPSERHKALVTYCVDHWCEDCPMLDPRLGLIDDEDSCLVSMAMDELRRRGLTDTTDPYWGTV